MKFYKDPIIMFGVIFTIAMCIALASAEVNNYSPVKQFECKTIIQTCSSCSYVNVSVAFPNSTIAITNAGMDSVGGGVWSYSFCNTSILGRYDVQGSGDLEGTATSFSVLWFDVTPSGFYRTTGFYILLLILSVGLIILGYYVKDAWIVVLGSFTMVLFGLFVLYYGIADVKDAVYTWGIGLVTLSIGSYFGLKGTLEKLDN